MTDMLHDGGRRLTERQRLNLNTLALEAELRERVRGEVRFDAGTRAAYAHDSSNYRQVPFGVVLPKDADDVLATMAVCRRHGAPVLSRGAGTSLSGETTNVAVILDFSKYMNRILEIDPDEGPGDMGSARVQPGVVHDQLTDITEPQYNLTFGPDTSTHKWATFGGMIGNNSCGIHSVMAGRTSDNVYEMDVVLYDGTRMTVGCNEEEKLDQIIAEGGRKGEIYRRLRELRDRYAGLIRERYPQIPRRVSGYNLDELLPEKGFNVARALVGSEGTLATVLSAKVRLVHSPPARSLLVLGYPSVYEAGDHISEILEAGPIGLEGIDERLVHNMLIKGMHEREVSILPEGNGWLLVEFGGESTEESDEKARRLMEKLRSGGAPPSMKLLDEPPQEQELWEVREAGLAATAHIPGEREHWPGWEDAAVHPDKVGDYLRDFKQLMDKHGYHAALYGHFGDGCIHCRIDFDLKTAEGLANWRAFMEEAADLVTSYGGSLSGEHGDGQQRAEFLPKMYGEELMQAFREFKAIWDPDWKMNPGKVIDANPMTSNLNLGTDYDPHNPKTHFAYLEDGGSFANASLRCVGVGRCRDTSSGTMCPSYMVTREEEHSTRGRARILHEMLRGQTITDGFKSQEVFDALDLCLSCKGCKGDCPVHVDMATYKAEFLSKYYKGRLRPAYAYTMGLIMLHARLAQYAPRLANFVTQTPGVSALVKRLGGIAPEREMPPFATRTFKDWMREHTPRHTDGPPVVLFPDTFNNFLHPETMKASVEVLEAAGYRVLVPQEALCCGRPLYDYGMLDTAGRFLRRLVDSLAPYVREGIKVVVVEPSCAAAFRDELPNMMPHDEDANRLVKNTRTLSEFLVEEDYVPPKLDRKAIFHSHCQGEAVIGTQADVELMRRIGLDYEVLDSGCCGLAGSFGFERDHYDISMRIGERRLLPAVREAGGETLLIADGFSCKTQVEQGTDRRPLHLAQVIKMALDHGEEGPGGAYPERAYPDVVLDDGGPGVKALAAAGGIAAAAAIAWGLRRRA
ncbi:FAD-binding and (Fe-S)-binding domain-containing protein [Rubrobacter naiadicus]|uniref:FAD-binding and (Fe-S)-binding domain-containing protein n=1 Tax=Rubrobacter naiadicus TaxID=1392641 RepID=UPI0023611BBC|nr:FAD-binding and (Fe-S)-binding domain-containing protein [Rubrobacter naiadicus]